MSNHSSILDKEHGEILEHLEEAASKGNRVAKIFTEIFAGFRYHLGEENETIVPLLQYLKQRADGNIIEPDATLLQAEYKFSQNYNSMIKEHRAIQDLIRRAQKELIVSPDEASMDLSNNLLHHIELEEEFLYPAAKAAGEILRYQESSQKV